jgi:hypothetical protein
LIYEDKHHATNHCSPETHQKESDWQLVFRNGEHASFVQGVAYDPLGVYIASMGSDRTVRVFPRKFATKPSLKKKVLRPSNAPRTVSPPQEHQRLVERLLTESKLEIGKPKRIKQRLETLADGDTVVKQKLFCDESTCESFFRRLSWTTDGAYLVCPAALWHPNTTGTGTTGTDPQDQNNNAPPSFSTFLFARHRFDEPCKVLSGVEKVRLTLCVCSSVYQMLVLIIFLYYCLLACFDYAHEHSLRSSFVPTPSSLNSHRLKIPKIMNPKRTKVLPTTITATTRVIVCPIDPSFAC